MWENRSCPQSDMALFYDDEKNSFIILQKRSRSRGASTSAFPTKRIELAWFCAQSISLPQAGCAQATGRPPGSIGPTGLPKGGREAPASLRAFQAAVVGSSCRTRSCVVAPVGMSVAPCRWCMADRRVRTPCAVSGTIPNHHPLCGDPEWCFHRDPRPAAAPCG